jgi:adenylosuccinate synthase
MQKIKAIILVGLNYGDEGKGSVTDSLVQHFKSDLVVRYNGGFQAAHNVHNETGHHTFHQFGSGTLSGARTYIGSEVIISPKLMMDEADSLYKLGVDKPLSLIHISPNCRITTLYHIALNQMRELARTNVHGSTGNGIGVTAELARQRSSWVLRVRDLSKHKSDVLQILNSIYEYCFLKCVELQHDYKLESQAVEDLMLTFNIPQLNNQLYDIYLEWLNQVNVCHSLDIIKDSNLPIFEGAQGVLLDKLHGFHPYTTWSDTTPTYAMDMLYILGIPIQNTYKLGITRTFMTRHGNGPLLTETNDLNALIAHDHNKTGKFQGCLRVGNLDLMALQYAIQKCGGLNGLAVTHCDYLSNREVRTVCWTYAGIDLLSYNCKEEAGLEAWNLTKAYSKNKALLYEVPDLLAEIQKVTKLPIVITSHSKFTKDKLYMGLEQNELPATYTPVKTAVPIVEEVSNPEEIQIKQADTFQQTEAAKPTTTN